MVYLCDFACWRPPQSHAAPLQRLPWGAEFDPGSSEEVLRKHPALGDPTCLAHLRFVHENSGSLSAFGPPGFVELGALPWKTAPDDSYEACLAEMRTSFGGALRLLFSQNPGLRPSDVDVLVTNSSIFAATPSLSSMLVNDFGFSPSVTTLSVAGMGCSFGVLGVGALRDLLRGHDKSRKGKNVNAVFVTGECITAGFYLGKDPTMLASTGLLRQGAAAVWLSTRGSFSLGGGKGGGGRQSGGGGSKKVKVRARYKLQHFSKTHQGADDMSYRSMGMRSDEYNGAGGVEQQRQQQQQRPAIYFSGDIPRAASKAIDAVLRALAPRLMSPGQLVRALLALRREKRQKREAAEDEAREKSGLPPRRRRRGRGKSSSSASSPPSPGFSFASCCEHFALHPGVHSMLVAFMKGMRLPVQKALPSFAALRDYGNLSSASTWYVLANLECPASPGVRRGERVLQLGVGSGVKAGACVWRALRDVKGVDHEAWRHLEGVAVEEKDLPLAVPDVLALEAAKRAALAAAAAAGDKSNDGGGGGDDEALEAATAVVSTGMKLVSSSAASEEERKAEGARRAAAMKQARLEVRPAAVERAAALARELDALHLERRKAAAAVVTKEC